MSGATAVEKRDRLDVLRREPQLGTIAPSTTAADVERALSEILEHGRPIEAQRTRGRQTRRARLAPSITWTTSPSDAWREGT